jgi:hypothetical protein
LQQQLTDINRFAFFEWVTTLYINGMRRFFSLGVAGGGGYALMKVLLARNCRIFFACLHYFMSELVDNTASTINNSESKNFK